MASAFSAVRWVLFGSLASRVLSLGGQMLILRLVAKDDYGVYRAIVLIHMICLTILPLSIDTLVIREKRLFARYMAALSMALGVVGGLLALGSLALSLLPGPGSASWLAQILELGKGAEVLYLMPPLFIVQALKLSVRAAHNAALNFRTISIGEFGNLVITWLGGAAAVAIYPQPIVLLFAFLLGEVFECWWMYRGQTFRPLAIFRRIGGVIFPRVMRRHKRYALFNTGDLTLNNLASLLPGVLMLALISKEATAEYSVMLVLLVMPTMLFAGAIWRVAFPAVSGASESELQRRFLRIIGASAAFVAPVVMWFAVFADSAIFILADEDYVSSTAPLLRWMAPYMFLVSIFTPISSLDMIRDVPHVGLIWNIIYTAGRVALIYIFAADGLLAVVAALAIFSVAMWTVQAYILGVLLRAPWKSFLTESLKMTPAWILLLAGLHLCLVVTNGHVWFAPALSAIPCALYVAAVYFFYPNEKHMIRKMLRR